jgi:hypothetical protein
VPVQWVSDVASDLVFRIGGLSESQQRGRTLTLLLLRLALEQTLQAVWWVCSLKIERANTPFLTHLLDQVSAASPQAFSLIDRGT